MLGVVPLIPIFIASAAGAAGMFKLAWDSKEEDNWKASLPAPARTPAPAAPATAEQMKTWTPADLAKADLANFQAWKSYALAHVPSSPDEDDDKADNNTLMIAAAAVGLIAAALLFRSK